jgi:hypothetical protein
MSKTKDHARSFLQKAAQSEQNFKESFEVVSPSRSPTIGIAITVNLTPEEERQIQKILEDDYRPDAIPEEAMEEHIKKLTDITRQIKSINAQSVLLHGQRIKEAKEILKDYRDGAFSKWLMATYGNRQTPYSMLQYYELYQTAPVSHKAIIEAAPKKAVYLLASRKGDLDKKMELLQNHGKSKQSELVLLIQETFPIAENDQRQPKNSSAIETLNKACQKLEKNKRHLSDEDFENINQIIKRLQKLCDLS